MPNLVRGLMLSCGLLACGAGGAADLPAAGVPRCVADTAGLSGVERRLLALPADSWLALPGTAFRKFCEANAVPALEANGGCRMAVEAWSGGVFDDERRQMLVIGGGHMDYWGNEVYAFAPASGRWRIVRPASRVASGALPSEPMPDGAPVSRHTYDSLAYMRHLGQVFLFGGAIAPNGYSENTTWWFDPANARWQPKASAPRSGAGHYYMATAYDPLTQQVYIRNERGFYAYDPTSDRWSWPLVDFSVRPYYPRQQTHHYRRAVVMPEARLFVALGGMLANPAAPDVFIYDLERKRDVTPDYPMRGDLSVIANQGVGLDVDTASGALVAWAGGAPAIMDPQSWEWRRGSARGAPPKAVGNGTFGRWRYIPYLNVFMLVNKPEEDVHFYKLTAGCGPAAPADARRRERPAETTLSR